MINEDKALKLLNEVSLYKCENVDTAPHKDLCVAFRRAIERHEAFRQEVSDALQSWVEGGIDRPAYLWFRKNLEQFIIAKHKPDPLVDAMNDIGIGVYENIKTEYADTLRADLVRRFRDALEARGFEIREKNDD